MTTLRQIREEKGVKQIAVASYLQVARQTYAKYEEHPETMTIQQARAVCKFLGCEIEQIFLPQDVN